MDIFNKIMRSLDEKYSGKEPDDYYEGDTFVYEPGVEIPGMYNRIKRLIVSNDVDRIPDRACWMWPHLERVMFESGSQVTRIGSSAFAWCESLSSIVIPKGVISIGGHAFEGSGLTSVVFEEGSQIAQIDSWAFGDTDIETIRLPGTIKYLYTEVFRNTPLKKIEVEGDYKPWLFTPRYDNAWRNVTGPNVEIDWVDAGIVENSNDYRKSRIEENMYDKTGKRSERVQELYDKAVEIYEALEDSFSGNRGNSSRFPGKSRYESAYEEQHRDLEDPYFDEVWNMERPCRYTVMDLENILKKLRTLEAPEDAINDVREMRDEVNRWHRRIDGDFW